MAIQRTTDLFIGYLQNPPGVSGYYTKTEVDALLAGLSGGGGGDNPSIGGLDSNAAPAGTPSVGGLDSTST